MVARTLLERHGGSMNKRYSFPGIVVTEPIKEEIEKPLIEGNYTTEAFCDGTSYDYAFSLCPSICLIACCILVLSH